MLFPLSEEQLEKYKIVDWGYTEKPEAQSYSHFTDWVEKGDVGPLTYLTGQRQETRKNLEKFFPQYQSALVFLFSYAHEKKALEEFYQSSESNGLKISSYVLGFEGYDYHDLVKAQLQDISQMLQKEDPELEVTLAMDIHPVMDRDLAYKAGLGWFGKNSMMIHRKEGSFTIIGSLLLSKRMNLETSTDLETDHCGQCRKCIEACPTDAIDEENRRLYANRCISTYTIELFKEAPEIPGHVDQGGGEIFGCDICQDVCPWNIRLLKNLPVEKERLKAPKAQEVMDFFLKRPLEKVIQDVRELSNRAYKRKFWQTPLERTGKKGMLKNLKLILKKDSAS